MFVDCDRHVGVGQYSDLFSHMPLAWQRHFERVEFVSSIDEASNHIRVSERWDHPHVDVGPPADDGDEYLLVPHQGLTINGWADRVGAKVFAAAINSYGLENWAGPTRKLALVVVLSVTAQVKCPVAVNLRQSLPSFDDFQVHRLVHEPGTCRSAVRGAAPTRPRGAALYRWLE